MEFSEDRCGRLYKAHLAGLHAFLGPDDENADSAEGQEFLQEIVEGLYENGKSVYLLPHLPVYALGSEYASMFHRVHANVRLPTDEAAPPLPASAIQRALELRRQRNTMRPRA